MRLARLICVTLPPERLCHLNVRHDRAVMKSPYPDSAWVSRQFQHQEVAALGSDIAFPEAACAPGRMNKGNDI
jgi:hypothetical protein